MESKRPIDRKPAIPFLGESRRVFMAGMLANIMYLTLAAAFASNFFEKLSTFLKVVIGVFAIFIALVAVLLYPSVKNTKGE